MTAYFVAADGAQTGPFTIEEVKAQCGRGEIRKDTLMWREGLSEWQSAEQVLAGTGISFSDNVPQPPGPPPVSFGTSQSRSAGQNEGLHFDVPAASLSAGRGVSWMAEGWKLFTAAPGMWIVALLIWFGVQVLIGFIPIVGTLAGLLLGPVFAVGLLSFAHGLSTTGNADLATLFAGFKNRLGDLIVLALLYLLMMIAAAMISGFLAFTVLGGSELFSAASPEQALSMILAGGFLQLLLVVLIALTLFALVLTAYLYAPALVFFANQTAGAALKQSFAACWKNWLPILVTGLLAIVMIVIGSLPFGLGLLIVFPVLFAANYASFKDMFGRA